MAPKKSKAKASSSSSSRSSSGSGRLAENFEHPAQLPSVAVADSASSSAATRRYVSCSYGIVVCVFAHICPNVFVLSTGVLLRQAPCKLYALALARRAMWPCDVCVLRVFWWFYSAISSCLCGVCCHNHFHSCCVLPLVYRVCCF